MNMAVLLMIVALARTEPYIVVPDVEVDARECLSTTISFSSKSVSEGDTLIVTAVVHNVSDSEVLWRPALVVGRRAPATSDGTIEEQVTATALASMPLARTGVPPGTMRSVTERSVSWHVLPANAECRLECRVPWDAVAVDQEADNVVLEARLELDGRDPSGQPLGQHLSFARETLRVE